MEDTLDYELDTENNEVEELTDTRLDDILNGEPILLGANKIQSNNRNGGLTVMANELATYRASTVGSEEILYFVEVPTDVATWNTKAYHMALLMAESNTMDSGVETEDVADVTVKTANHVIKSYKKTFSSSGVYLKGEPVNEFMRYLFDHDETGDKTVVNLLQVYTFEGDNTQGYTAYKYRATCEVTQGVGGDAQDKAHIEATYTITSEAVAGTVTYDKDSGVATFTPA